MNPFTCSPNRQTLRLCALGVAVLLGGGCRHLGHHRAKIQSHRIAPLRDADLSIINPGYCETRWTSLTPTMGPGGYIEHYVGDIEQTSMPDVQDSSASPSLIDEEVMVDDIRP